MNQIKWEHVDFNKIHKEILDDDDDMGEPEGTTPWMNDESITIKLKSDDKIPRVIGTPFGMFRTDNILGPFKHCEYQLGYTNFDITEPIAEAICDIPGVEVFQVLTRYKFLLGVARLFKFSEVKSIIEFTVLGKENNDIYLKEIEALNPEVHKLVCNEKSKVSERHDYWALFVFPNGKITSEGFPGEAEMNKGMEKFNKLKELTKGYLLSSTLK